MSLVSTRSSHWLIPVRHRHRQLKHPLGAAPSNRLIDMNLLTKSTRFISTIQAVIRKFCLGWKYHLVVYTFKSHRQKLGRWMRLVYASIVRRDWEPAITADEFVIKDDNDNKK